MRQDHLTSIIVAVHLIKQLSVLLDQYGYVLCYFVIVHVGVSVLSSVFNISIEMTILIQSYNCC